MYDVILVVTMTRCFIIARGNAKLWIAERSETLAGYWVKIEIFSLLGEVNKVNIMYNTFINYVTESIWLSRHLNANYIHPLCSFSSFVSKVKLYCKRLLPLDQFSHRQRSPDFNKHSAAIWRVTISIPLFSCSINSRWK